MNFKTKAIGLLAGSALAMSLVTGAMAVEGDTAAELLEGDPCSVAALGSTFDFGDYQYTGSGYTAPATPGTLSISVSNTTFNASGTNDCEVTVVPSDLESDTTATDIPSAAVALTVNTGGSGTAPTFTATTGTPLVLNGQLTVSQLTAVAPGEYEGTIEVTAVSAD